MTSSPRELWAIEHAGTRELLGTHDRLSMAGLEFGARMPLFYSSLRATRDAWVRASCQMGYLVRGVTLPREGVVYNPGPDFAAWPSVRMICFNLDRRAMAVDTVKDLGIAIKK